MMSLDLEAREQAALNSKPSAMVTSPGWQCPVCDRPGDQHEPRCFVKDLADEAHQLRVANKRLSQTNGRLRAASVVLKRAAVGEVSATRGTSEGDKRCVS